MTPEQEKQVEEIRSNHSRFVTFNSVSGHQANEDRSALLAIVEDLRKQLNAAVLLGQAAASLNKPMTDAEFEAELESAKMGGNNKRTIDLLEGKVDSLRKQQQKQSNGGEIMAECFRAYDVKHEYESFAAGWLAAFRMMGAIKE